MVYLLSLGSCSWFFSVTPNALVLKEDAKEEEKRTLHGIHIEKRTKTTKWKRAINIQATIQPKRSQ